MSVTDDSARRRRIAVAVLSALLGIALAWFTRWRIEESQRPAFETAEVSQLAGSGSGDEVIAEGSGLIVGQVVLPDGAPAPGARVTVTVLANGAAPRVTTDAEGRFRVVSRGAGTVVVQAELAGYGPGFETATLGQPEPVLLTLQGGSIIRGRVTRDGQPAAGIFVHAGQAGMFPQQQALTDGAGLFAIGGLRVGSVELIATDTLGGTGFESVLVPAVAEGSASEVEVQFEVEPAPAVAVTIVDKITGAPVEMAVVTVSRDVMHVLALSEGVEQGLTTIDYLPVGELFSLSVRAPGYLPWQQELAVRPEMAIKVELSQGGTVTGRVVNGADVPVGGAAVYAIVRDKAGSVWEVRKSTFDNIHPLVRPEGTFFWVPTIDFVSRADGSFILTGLPEGEAVVVAESKGMSPGLSGLLQLRADVPTSGVRLVLRPGRALRGRVEDEAKGAIEGASVVVRSTGFPPWWTPAPRVTSADGIILFDGLTEQVEVAVSHPDYQPLKTRFVLPEQGLDDQHLVLLRDAGRLMRGRLYLPRGKAAAGATVWFTRGGGEQPVCSAEVREDGWFETEPCRAEPDRLLAALAEVPPLSVPVAGFGEPADYRFGRGAELEMAAEGMAVEVSLALSPAFPAALYTLPKGAIEPWKRMRFSGLAPGDYTVTCTAAGKAPASLRVALAADQRVEKVCPAMRSEREGSVIVVDPQGAPVAGAFVRRAGAVAGPWVVSDAKGVSLLKGTDGELVSIEASHVAWGSGSASLTLGRDAKPARLALGSPICGVSAEEVRAAFREAGLALVCDGRAALVEAIAQGSAAAGRGLMPRDRILWLDGLGSTTLRVTVQRDRRAVLFSIPVSTP